MDKNYEVIKLALVKACKYLRELNGVNPFVIPALSDTKDSDVDGTSWLLFLIEEANKEIDNN